MNCNKQKLFVKDGLIIKHTDDFDLYKWLQANVILPDFLLGWTAFSGKISESNSESLQSIF
jgi:hypothetical protein